MNFFFAANRTRKKKEGENKNKTETVCISLVLRMPYREMLLLQTQNWQWRTRKKNDLSWLLISNVFMYLSVDDQFTHFIAHTHTFSHSLHTR